MTQSLETAYAAGRLTQDEWTAASAWRDDGRDIMRAEQRPRRATRKGPKREHVVDIMRASAADRFKGARKAMMRLDVDTPMLDLVFRGGVDDEPQTWAWIKDGMQVLVIKYGLRKRDVI